MGKKKSKKDVVCGYKHMTGADIEAAVEAGATGFSDAKRMTGAVAKCGKCRSAMKKCLGKALATLRPVRSSWCTENSMVTARSGCVPR